MSSDLIEDLLPDHFSDVEIVAVLKGDLLGGHISEDDQTLLKTKYPLTCGLILKLRCGNYRVVKRSRMRAPRVDDPSDCYVERLFRLVKHYTAESHLEYLTSQWSPDTIAAASAELSKKGIFLSPYLRGLMNRHPLLPLNPVTNRVSFLDSFVEQVAIYHRVVERPTGTFASPVVVDGRGATIGDLGTEITEDDDGGGYETHSTDSNYSHIDEGAVENEAGVNKAVTDDGQSESTNQDLGAAVDATHTIGDTDKVKTSMTLRTSKIVSALTTLDREHCPQCYGRRQVYCGDCIGVRMPGAVPILPERITLPFDVLLVLHWQETLHKCTGVQAAVLCQYGTVDVAKWPKVKNGTAHWGDLVASLDPDRDVILFPADGAVLADTFPWIREDTTVNNTSIQSRVEEQSTLSASVLEKIANEEISNSLSPSSTDVLSSVSVHATAPAPATAAPMPAVVESSTVGVKDDISTGNSPNKPESKSNSCNRRTVSNSNGNRNMNNSISDSGSSNHHINENGSISGDNSSSGNSSGSSSNSSNCHSHIAHSNGTDNAYETVGSSRATLPLPSSASSSSLSSAPSPPISTTNINNKRWRLVVLEASWAHGQTMFRQITAHRHKLGLPPLPSVILEDITGEYWRFHEFGHSAVSTIEAIAHTARAAGTLEENIESLLVLFQLQKHRVLRKVEDGGKAPKAMVVSGEGLGSWSELTEKFRNTNTADINDS